MHNLAVQPTPRKEPVLSKAVVRAAALLGVTQAQLARVLGVSPASVSRLNAGTYELAEGRKEWEFGLLFVRLFRALDSIVGAEDTARRWMANDNRVLNGRPIDLIQSTEGLVRVVQYLDASRASL